MFTKILIANRGEIACRVIETAHQLGIRCVAVYSDADENARHVSMADEAYHIGPSPSKDSYLKGDVIIEVAKRAGAQAIHPGYGFLSENPEFAKACAEANIVFIGPPVGAIEAMGSKSAAKAIMQKANVPLVPGYHGDDQSAEKLKAEADAMGYPVLLKAAFGGGGKGMRVVWEQSEFTEALESAKREAISGFGNDEMLLEKYLTQPRHVEIQVFADQHGHGVYLSERDCSIQRRHQKVIEEAPAPNLSPKVRKAMGEAAVRAAQAINYVGAGTVEFLYDIDGSFYFMEMNTRLQVEHPVTEMITGQDLVKWQLLVASGESLPLAQEDVQLEGHAIEVRIYAEDPDNDFLPATGRLNYLRQPEASRYVRVDTGVRQNDEVSAFYDPMIAKLIVWDETRERAIQRMLHALDAYRISGVTTNLSFLSTLLEHPAFQKTELETQFINKYQDDLYAPSHNSDNQALALAGLYKLLKQKSANESAARDDHDPYSPWHQFSGWRLNEQQQHRVELIDRQDHQHHLSFIQQGEQYKLSLTHDNGDAITLHIQGALQGDHLQANVEGHQFSVLVSEFDDSITIYNKQQVSTFTYVSGQQHHSVEDDAAAGLAAPMNGTIVKVAVNAGDTVEKGQTVIIMEAMKMEYAIEAPAAGTINEIYFSEGEMVADGADLVDFTPLTDD